MAAYRRNLEFTVKVVAECNGDMALQPLVMRALEQLSTGAQHVGKMASASELDDGLVGSVTAEYVEFKQVTEGE